MLSLCFLPSAAALILSLLILILVALLAFPVLGIGFTLIILFFIEIIAINLVRRLTMKELARIGTLLFDQCDPESYIKKNRSLLRRLLPFSRYTSTVKSNLAVGYYSFGETEKGIELCRELETKLSSRDMDFAPVLYMNLCTMLLSLGAFEEANAAFDKAYSAVLRVPEKMLLGRRYRRQINLLELRRHITIGDIEGCEPQLLQHLSKAVTRYEKANLQNLLSIYYKSSGEEEKYKGALQYLAEHGNKLYMAENARKLLREME